MSTRRSPSGPRASVTGFVAFAQTVINISTAAGGNVATATGILTQFKAPGSTVQVRVDPRRLTLNDIVTGSPRGTVPLATSQISVQYLRVSSVGSASAVIEIGYVNPNSAASATAVANTWNLSVELQKSDGLA
jgi:hypothetical protein